MDAHRRAFVVIVSDSGPFRKCKKINGRPRLRQPAINAVCGTFATARNGPDFSGSGQPGWFANSAR